MPFHTLLNSHSITLAIITSSPVHLQVQREAKRAAKGSAGDIGYTGLSPTGLHELALLQHIAYCAAASSSKGHKSASGQGLGLAVPLAVASVSMTAETPSQDRRLVSLQPMSTARPSSLGTTAGGHFGYQPSSSSHTNTSHYKNTGSSHGTSGMGQSDVALGAALVSIGCVGTGERVQRFLVFPAIQLALSSVLPLIPTPTSSSTGSGSAKKYDTSPSSPVVSASLALSWCRDILGAVEHCVRHGVYFRWIALEQIGITAGGRVLLCGLNGAILGTDYVHSLSYHKTCLPVITTTLPSSHLCFTSHNLTTIMLLLYSSLERCGGRA